ncbi:MAG TPA: hypothetical protein VIJ64_00005, partial [Candidatus Lustribacter sp.]
MTVRAKALRRRAKPSLAGRIRTLWVLAALALVVVLALGAAVANAPQLRVRSVAAVVPVGGPLAKSAV